MCYKIKTKLLNVIGYMMKYESDVKKRFASISNTARVIIKLK